MRDGWKEISLGQLTENTRPICYGVLKPGPQVDGGVPLVKITDMDRRILGPEGMQRISKELDDEFRRSRLLGGEVLLSIQGTVGRVAIAASMLKGANISRTIAVIDPDDRLLNLYLMYVLEKIATEGEFDSAGSTRESLNISTIRSMKIWCPPIAEQRRIVDLVSSVDSYIEALQQRLESAKKSRNALIENQILDLSNSPLFSLKNLSTKIGSGATPRGGEEVYIETGVNLIRSQNVHDSNFVMRGLVAIEDSAAKALDNVTVEEGDVLINITGASVTRCCVVDSTILPARVNQHVAIIRSDRAKVLPKYLVLVLTSNEVKGFLNDIAGTGSTRQALTKTHLEDLEIPVPSISKQAATIENSDAFDATISKLQITLDRAKFLRSGLLSELLAGEHEIPASYDKVIGLA